MKKAVLVLGGGSGQLTLLKYLKKKDCQIILQDINHSCPGRNLADEFVLADTTDSAAASLAAVRFKVSGVLTAGTDQPVLAAAIASEARGCPALHNRDTALALTDKEVMKDCLGAAGIPIPKYCVLGADSSKAGLKDLRYPWVVKPVDSQGQRGVVRLDTSHNFETARDAALKFSNRNRIIVEAYHSHREVTVSGWMDRGKLTLWAITDRVTRDFLPHIGLCLAHRFPSAYAAGVMDEVSELTDRCTRALGMENGPVYFQFLVTEEGVLVNECAGRLGGAYEDISLPPVCGNHPPELLIAGTLEGNADPKESRFQVKKSASAFAVPLMFCHPGRISHMSGESAVRALPGITAFSFLQKNGANIGPPRNSVQRAAYLVAHGKSPREVNRILKRAVPRIRIEDNQGRQVLRNPLGYALNPN